MGLDPNNLPASFRDKMVGAKEVMKTDTSTRLSVPQVPCGQNSGAVTTGAAQSVQNTRQFTLHTDPVSAPRMTRRDKWLVGAKRRPCVQRYFDYRDKLRLTVGDMPVVPDELRAIFLFAMPDSWSKKRRQEMFGKPHRQRPDGDNCMKAIQDALFLEDGGVWKGAFEKRWAVHGRVEIEMRWL